MDNISIYPTFHIVHPFPGGVQYRSSGGFTKSFQEADVHYTAQEAYGEMFALRDKVKTEVYDKLYVVQVSYIFEAMKCSITKKCD